MTYRRTVEVLELWFVRNSEIVCCICGEMDLCRWGIPVSSETGLIIANDSEEDWGSKPACESCWKRHESGEFVGQDTRF